MNLELDHVFILVEPEARVADLLIEQGFKEGTRNQHPGQGTSNRRFFLPMECWSLSGVAMQQ